MSAGRWIVSAIDRGAYWQVVVKDAMHKPRPCVMDDVVPHPTRAPRHPAAPLRPSLPLGMAGQARPLTTVRPSPPCAA